MKAARIPHSTYLTAQGNIMLRPENLEWVNFCMSHSIYKYNDLQSLVISMPCLIFVS